MRISPEETASSPAIRLSNVDLPQPEGPSSTRNPPVSTLRLMPLSATKAPNSFLTSRRTRELIASPLDRPGCQASEKPPPGEQVDDEGRDRSDHRGRHVDIVFLDPKCRI